MTRVLILSWEYPPLIEGGLARHVRKLSEALTHRGHSGLGELVELVRGAFYDSLIPL